MADKEWAAYSDGPREALDIVKKGGHFVVVSYYQSQYVADLEGVVTVQRSAAEAASKVAMRGAVEVEEYARVHNLPILTLQLSPGHSLEFAQPGLIVQNSQIKLR